MTTRSRRAITRIDMMVVVLALILVVLLALPWLTAVRDAARRRGCMNNLRLLGGALQRYTARHECLPPAAYWTTEGLETDKIYKSDAVWPNITAV